MVRVRLAGGARSSGCAASSWWIVKPALRSKVGATKAGAADGGALGLGSSRARSGGVRAAWRSAWWTGPRAERSVAGEARHRYGRQPGRGAELRRPPAAWAAAGLRRSGRAGGRAGVLLAALLLAPVLARGELQRLGAGTARAASGHSRRPRPAGAAPALVAPRARRDESGSIALASVVARPLIA